MKSIFSVLVMSWAKSISSLIPMLSFCALTSYSSFALSNEASLLGLWDFYVPTTKGVELVKIEVSGMPGGVYMGEEDKLDLKNIVIEGSTFSFDIDKRKFFSSFTLTYGGTVEGDRINGYVDTPMGPKSYRAVR